MTGRDCSENMSVGTGNFNREFRKIPEIKILENNGGDQNGKMV